MESDFYFSPFLPPSLSLFPVFVFVLVPVVLWSEPRAPCMPELRKALQTILAQGSPQKGRFAGLTLRLSCPWLGKGRGNCGHLGIEKSSVHGPYCLPSPIPHPDVCEEGGWGRRPHRTPSATQSHSCSSESGRGRTRSHQNMTPLNHTKDLE